MCKTPSELVIARSDAFSSGDFGFIYDSYHPESNFRRQFAERSEYIEFGRLNLGQDYQIINCEVLDQKEYNDEAQVIFLMKMKVHGAAQSFAELAWLRCDNNQWFYHRGLKMTCEDLPDNPHSLSFEDFSRLDQSTVF